MIMIVPIMIKEIVIMSHDTIIRMLNVTIKKQALIAFVIK